MMIKEKRIIKGSHDTGSKTVKQVDVIGYENKEIIAGLKDFGFSYIGHYYYNYNMYYDQKNRIAENDYELRLTCQLPFLSDYFHIGIVYQLNSSEESYLYDFSLKTGKNQLSEEQARWLLYYTMVVVISDKTVNIEDMKKNMLLNAAIDKDKLEF